MGLALDWDELNDCDESCADAGECPMVKQGGEKRPVHDEFTRRIDERWVEHTKHQIGVNGTLFDRIERINSKLNWILGAMAVGLPLMQIIFHLLWRGKP
jgi:hypothetical protein